MLIFWLILPFLTSCDNPENEEIKDLVFFEDSENQEESFRSEEISLNEEIIHEPIDYEEDEILR